MNSFIQAENHYCSLHLLCTLPLPFSQQADKLLQTPQVPTSGVSPPNQVSGASRFLLWQATITMEKDVGVNSRAWGKPKLPRM